MFFVPRKAADAPPPHRQRNHSTATTTARTMMRIVATLLVSSVGLAAAQTLSQGGSVSAEDAAREMPVLGSAHPLATEGETVTLQRFSDAGVMIALDKSHCG